jgi:hypothetical protein
MFLLFTLSQKHLEKVKNFMINLLIFHFISLKIWAAIKKEKFTENISLI